MEKLRYREIEKTLPEEFEQIAFSITGYVRKQGFNKYEFRYIRERIYQEAEKLMQEKVSKEAFIKKLNLVADKYLSNGLKKTLLENIASILFIIFTIACFSLPIIYGVNLNKNKDDYHIFALGFDINISLSIVFSLVIYFALGLGIALLMQKIDLKKKIRALIVFALFIFVSLIIIKTISNQHPNFIIRLNIFISEIVLIILIALCYYVEDIVAKKRFSNKYTKFK